MIRLTLLLCAGLFCAMLIGGQDRGQQRFGLMAPPRPVAVATPAAERQPLIARPVQSQADVAMFAPAQPVMALPVAADSLSVADAVAVAVPITGKVLFVGAESVNVRTGPGKDFEVVGRLTRGEGVLVVADGDGAAGWSLIKIEGDGIEGYVASRLLTE